MQIQYFSQVSLTPLAHGWLKPSGWLTCYRAFRDVAMGSISQLNFSGDLNPAGPAPPGLPCPFFASGDQLLTLSGIRSSPGGSSEQLTVLLLGLFLTNTIQ